MVGAVITFGLFVVIILCMKYQYPLDE